MKRISAEMASLNTKLMPYSTSKLALCPRVSYEEREKKYRQFIEDKNAERSEQVPPEPPLEPFTRFSFNIDLLKNYVIYRSITGLSRVEDKIQLGTMIREITHLADLHLQWGPKDVREVFYSAKILLIIINNCLKEASISGSTTFEFQVIVFLLVVLYSGARPSSISKSVKHDDAKYMQWKHVQIWRQGRDERGYKINVVIQLPHLKGRGKYFSESNRTFKKTFSSAVTDGVGYERNYPYP
ncbi:hypothetical protein INT47_010199 [Mucor saturninus]|uniref:Uncharacterized protein n=1 Tax=Mucor saturninus TaxID=64648 RepID=A0A8H7RD70_9FUNG|nr:hypothetical protein INT47_010199 [Mucor saturninus]